MVHTHKAPFYNPYDLVHLPCHHSNHDSHYFEGISGSHGPTSKKNLRRNRRIETKHPELWHSKNARRKKGKRIVDWNRLLIFWPFFQTYFFKSDRRKVTIKVFVGTPAQDIIQGAKVELGVTATNVHFTDETGDPVIVSSTAPDGSTFILKEGAPDTTSSRWASDMKIQKCLLSTTCKTQLNPQQWQWLCSRRLTASRSSARPDTTASQRLNTSASAAARATTSNGRQTTANIRRQMDPVVTQNAETTARLMGQITGKCVDPGNPNKSRK